MAEPDTVHDGDLPAGTLVLVSMPGNARWGVVGEVVDQLAVDGVRVRVLTGDVVNVPYVVLVPAGWVRKLNDVFDMFDELDNRLDSGGGA